ncbi:class I SAM-dependent methyltransferase [Streptosporangium sp. DT93]|uniref:class I SAM-dependent methyltransferase n=1 Tax=Streptosporangium sp. DT93 TaxID=3393428 RepID=UPI003CF07D52
MSAGTRYAADWAGLLRSPLNGESLRAEGPWLLGDGETLWPCLAGIPYLRVGRDELREAAVSAISRGDRAGALALLLSDRKDDTIPAVEPASVLRAIGTGLTARETMDLLGYGALAPYFLHRWSLPTFLSGIALLETHARAGDVVCEIGCGLGQFLYAWTAAGAGTTVFGSDLVFSHLWLARRYTCPGARLVCFDADATFPLVDAVADVIFSHDSFHYFRRKAHVLSEMRRISSRRALLLGHVHNAEHPNHSPGSPLSPEEYRDLIEPDLVYDDADLTEAALTATAPRPRSTRSPPPSPALAFVREGASSASGPSRPPGVSHPSVPRTPCLSVPAPGARLRVNPLIGAAGVEWPGARFEDEFVDGWPYLSELRAPHPDEIRPGEIRLMEENDERLAVLARRRVLLQLPDRWL